MISLLFEIAAFLWFLQCGPWPCEAGVSRVHPPVVYATPIQSAEEAP